MAGTGAGSPAGKGGAACLDGVVNSGAPCRDAGGLSCGLWKNQPARAVDQAAFPSGIRLSQAGESVRGAGPLRTEAGNKEGRGWQDIAKRPRLVRPGGAC